MKFFIKPFLTILLICPVSAFTSEALSPLAGSVEKGRFTSEFVDLSVGKYADTERGAEVAEVEGAILSRILAKPQGKSNLDVFNLYESMLKDAGFTIEFSASPSGMHPRGLIQRLYGGPLDDLASRLYCSPLNDLGARQYVNINGEVSSKDLERIATHGEFYLYAIRRADVETAHVVVVLSTENNLYLVDEMTSRTMEPGTVTIDLKAMRAAIAGTGRVAIYDIFFAMDSSDIESGSGHALSVIAEFLGESSHRYFVVSHTDDSGTLDHNLKLSADRAAAVVHSLVTDHDVDADRLEPQGVGPLAPASGSNVKSGQVLNSRIEIVQRPGAGQ